MRKPALLILVNAMILVVVFALLAQSLWVVQRIAQANLVAGNVEVQRDGAGDFRRLALHQTVAVGDVVRTGSDGTAEFVWADKTRWKLLPNTQLTIARASVNSNKNQEESRLQLDAGKIFVRIAKPLAPASSFQIATPWAVAAAHGTVFSVEVKSGRTCVATYAGDVSLSSAGRQTVVPAGQMTITKIGAAGAFEAQKIAPLDFLRQPNFIRPQLETSARLVGKVGVVEGATEAGNRLTIGGEAVPLLGNGAFMKRVSVQPGHNQWQIVATDKHGATSTQCRALDYDAATGKASANACR